MVSATANSSKLRLHWARHQQHAGACAAAHVGLCDGDRHSERQQPMYIIFRRGRCYVVTSCWWRARTPVSVQPAAEWRFESALSPIWTNSTDFTNSTLSSIYAHSGNSSLHVVATAGGGANGGNNDSVQPKFLRAVNGQTYTGQLLVFAVTAGAHLTVKPTARAAEHAGRWHSPAWPGGSTWRRRASAIIGVVLHACGASQRQLLKFSPSLENHFWSRNSPRAGLLSKPGYDGTTAAFGD